MLTKKKKIKISKMLAGIIFIAESEKTLHPESFGKIVQNAFEVAYEVGGFLMMNTTMSCVKELRRRCDTE